MITDFPDSCMSWSVILTRSWPVFPRPCREPLFSVAYLPASRNYATIARIIHTSDKEGHLCDCR